MLHIQLSAVGVMLLTALFGPADEIRGVIARVDPIKKEIVVQARGAGRRGQSFTLTVTPDTRIDKGGQAVQLAELTAGKRVRASFELRGGQHVALSLSAPDLLGSLLGVVAPTPAPPPPPAAAAPAPASGESVAGELRRVAFTDRELVVLGRGGQETILAVPEGLAVIRNGKPAEFADLKEGEQAVVRFVPRDGKRVATSVQVGEAGAIPPQETRIQRLRRALKFVDELLDMADRAKILDR